MWTDHTKIQGGLTVHPWFVTGRVLYRMALADDMSSAIGLEVGSAGGSDGGPCLQLPRVSRPRTVHGPQNSTSKARVGGRNDSVGTDPHLRRGREPQCFPSRRRHRHSVVFGASRRLGREDGLPLPM